MKSLSRSPDRRIARSIGAAALLLAALACGEARAQSSMQGVPNAMQGFSQNRDQPIQIEAASLEVRDKAKEATFAGNVKVVQGDTTMTLRISGKSISVGDALRGRVSERTDEVLRKYFDGNYSGHITLSKDGFGFRTDCALHLDSGVVLEADSSAADAYASADQALLMIEKRLRRYKSRLKDRHGWKRSAPDRPERRR